MNKIIYALIAIIIILLGYKFIFSDTTNKSELALKQGENNFVFEELEYDFGIIKQSEGKVVHDFSFTYKGEEPIEITGVPTSCACVSAIINRTQLKSGDKGIVTVKFNPNLHEEPEGKFFKTISLITDPKIDEMPEIKIWVEIDLDLGEEAFELKSDHEEKEEDNIISYNSITPERLSKMLGNKDFILVDVHIPEQEHINQTDEIIPYNAIEANLDKFPKDKNAKIVLYCRSGGMSRAAAYTLVENGYTNVYDLVGGKNAFDEFQNNKILKANTEADYIVFDATIVKQNNIQEIYKKYDISSNDLLLNNEKTVVLLEMNNHRSNLEAFDYMNISLLDKESAVEWNMITSAMGGHHVVGTLIFPKNNDPELLVINNLPVGNVILEFTNII